ncbi:MAG TPA: hypothetical protein VK797_23175 [Tepidisphaeraceae bacterium]|jgi:hypothetical protein|nr:hypothetical protein [Tepidisphaeraceae bacterium]
MVRRAASRDCGFTSSGADAILYHIASATISGSTLTVTLDTLVTSGTTVVLDVLTSSNLTDALSNTAQGQTGQTITNNSTKTATSYGLTNAGLCVLGIDPTVQP